MLYPLAFLLLLTACVNCLAGRKRAPWNTPLFAISRSFDGPLFMTAWRNQLVSLGGMPPGRNDVPYFACLACVIFGTGLVTHWLPRGLLWEASWLWEREYTEKECGKTQQHCNLWAFAGSDYVASCKNKKEAPERPVDQPLRPSVQLMHLGKMWAVLAVLAIGVGKSSYITSGKLKM